MNVGVEAVVVGLTTMIVGLIISYLAMGKAAAGFQHWQRLATTFLATGITVHLLYEYSGANKWYCDNKK